MPQSLAQIYVPIVFSTKDRKPVLKDDGLRDELYAFMATIVRDNVDSPALVINGAEDHLHALIRLSRRFPIIWVSQEGTKLLDDDPLELARRSLTRSAKSTLFQIPVRIQKRQFGLKSSGQAVVKPNKQPDRW